MGQNLNLKLPDWAKKDDGLISLKSPLEMYYAGKEKDEYFPEMIIKCCGECGSEAHYHYKGLYKFISDLPGMDKYAEFRMEFTEFTKTNRLPETISVDFKDEKIRKAWDSYPDKVLKARQYKENLVKDIRLKLSFRYGELKVTMVIKSDGTVLLYKLSEKLADVVPDLCLPDSYSELLGVICHLDFHFDMDSIKEGYESSNRSILKELFVWIKTLFLSNGQELQEDELRLRVVKY